MKFGIEMDMIICQKRRETFDESLDQYCNETFEITDEENERDKSDESENSHVKKLIR